MSSDTPTHPDVSEAKQWLAERMDEGVDCPVCEQHVKVYRRQIHSTMARTLVLAYREHGLGWFHLPTLTKNIGRGGEESKFRYWDLLEEENRIRDDGGRAGWWRVTGRGGQFVLGQIDVAKYALIYNGRLLELDDSERVTIHDALGKKFRYDELMEGGS